MLIKRVLPGNYRHALALVLRVFLQYDAPDYPEHGVQTFKAAITDQAYLNSIEMWAAYSDERIVGVIALRNNSHHIALLFVDGDHHHKGIGRSLVEMARNYSDSEIITVNSSPYAVEFYRHLGFIPDGLEQSTDGMRYTPMTYKKQ